jgi:hypothetical protein
MYILVYIKKCMSMKPNLKEINIILNILKGAQFEFLPRAPFYIDTPLRECNFVPKCLSFAMVLRNVQPFYNFTRLTVKKNPHCK